MNENEIYFSIILFKMIFGLFFASLLSFALRLVCRSAYVEGEFGIMGGTSPILFCIISNSSSLGVDIWAEALFFFFCASPKKC